MGALTIVRRARGGGWTEIRETIEGMFALVVMWSGLVGVSVLLLISPPEGDHIPEHAMLLAGALVFVVCEWIGVCELHKIYFKPAGSRNNRRKSAIADAPVPHRRDAKAKPPSGSRPAPWDRFRKRR